MIIYTIIKYKHVNSFELKSKRIFVSVHIFYIRPTIISVYANFPFNKTGS